MTAARQLREAVSVLFLFLLGVAVLGALTGHAGAQEKKSLPPLIVGSDAPQLLGGSVETNEEVSASVAENTACYVCHANYQQEELVQWHADGAVGCVDCHGKSFAHRNDENNTTPPDVMFPRSEIDASCEECHDTHDVPAADVVARLQQRVARVPAGEPVVCTQCHGQHRLPHRTVVWDRATRRLLTGSKDSPAVAPQPRLDLLKQLSGRWVARDADGRPTNKVVSSYRVTSGGSAVVETLFPGSDNEMVTVYHQDGDQLLLTHYCSAQNQPRMQCVPGSDPQTLAFQFVDATNMTSPAQRHMRAVTLKILGPDHLQASWQSYENGQAGEPVVFDLVRQP